jgi:anaerobic magnesium-protoporphyrin IX monomethyl ester cyclase
VKIVDQTVKFENINRHIKAFMPDVVGVSVISAQASIAAVKVSKIAQRYKKPVVWGGQIISAVPELGFSEGCVDYIVIGEGEITFLELLKAIETGGSFADIDGLAFLNKGEVHINKYREFADLSTFPVLDYSLVNVKKYFQHFFGCKKMLYVYASKGCPAKCTFCFNPTFHRSTHRIRPVEYVVDEIEYLIKVCGADSVNFADEFWYPGRKEMYQFFDLIKERELNFVWGIQTRLGVFSRDDLQQMFNAGCRWILFGIESGCNERITKIKKGINLDKAKETFKNCREIGITSQSAFIIGYPDETEEELKETVAFALSLNANLCPFSILYLQPGSEMYEFAVSCEKFIPPKTLYEWCKIDIGEQNDVNLSKVPDKELKVIHYYTQWTAFADKEAINLDSFGIAKKMIADALRNMFRYGPSNVFAGGFYSMKQFFTVLWYAKAYPKIIEKYGLKNKTPPDV